MKEDKKMSKDNLNPVHLHRTHGKQKKRHRFPFFIIPIVLLLLAAAFLAPKIPGYMQRLREKSAVCSEESPSSELTPESEVYTVYFGVPNNKSFSIAIPEGSNFDLPAGPSIDGYTFLAWQDENGVKMTRGTISPTADTNFYALYAVAFKNDRSASTHLPYISLDQNGMIHPNAGVTRGEMVKIIYANLAVNGVGTGYFIDLEKDDPLYAAAATLKDLGLLEGDRLHAEDTVTFGEFFSLLAKLFPSPEREYTFTNLSPGSEYYNAFCAAYENGWLYSTETSPYDIITRKEFVRIVNSLIGRGGTEHFDVSSVGTIADISSSDEYYPDIAEALVEHEWKREGDSEIWTSSSPLPFRDPGFFFVGSDLHYIKADGNPALNEEVDYLLFDENGIVSSGDASLDELVRFRLNELVDPSQMDGEEMLRILYDYVVNDSFYLRGEKYETGETGWEIAEAYKMFSTGKGNCYSYAASFWALARAIGYDAVCYSGSVGTHSNPHGWVEITIDGTPYIFDPTLEYEQCYGPGTRTYEHFFKMTYKSVSGWLYNRG